MYHRSLLIVGDAVVEHQSEVREQLLLARVIFGLDAGLDSLHVQGVIYYLEGGVILG